MDLFLSIIKKLGGFRLTVIVGALGLLVGFFIYVMNGVNQSDMATLYSNLDPAEGGQIVSKLEALSIPHFVEENGTPDHKKKYKTSFYCEMMYSCH